MQNVTESLKITSPQIWIISELNPGHYIIQNIKLHVICGTELGSSVKVINRASAPNPIGNHTNQTINQKDI